jgi:hypothetical protein
MKKFLKNEKGFSTIFHITLLATFALSFNEIWNLYLQQQKLPIKVAGFAIFATFIIFGLISAILSVINGEKSKGEMKKIIYKESRKLAGILNEYSAEVAIIKVQLKKLTGIMKPEGFHELATVEGLLASLEGRLKKVNQNSQSRDINEVHYAYTSLLDDLSSNDDTMNAVMLSEAIKPIAIKNLKSELDQRISRIKKQIPYQRSYKAAA